MAGFSVLNGLDRLPNSLKSFLMEQVRGGTCPRHIQGAFKMLVSMWNRWPRACFLQKTATAPVSARRPVQEPAAAAAAAFSRCAYNTRVSSTLGYEGQPKNGRPANTENLSLDMSPVIHLRRLSFSTQNKKPLTVVQTENSNRTNMATWKRRENLFFLFQFKMWGDSQERGGGGGRSLCGGLLTERWMTESIICSSWPIVLIFHFWYCIASCLPYSW